MTTAHAAAAQCARLPRTARLRAHRPTRTKAEQCAARLWESVCLTRRTMIGWPRGTRLRGPGRSCTTHHPSAGRTPRTRGCTEQSLNPKVIAAPAAGKASARKHSYPQTPCPQRARYARTGPHAQAPLGAAPAVGRAPCSIVPSAQLQHWRTTAAHRDQRSPVRRPTRGSMQTARPRAQQERARPRMRPPIIRPMRMESRKSGGSGNTAKASCESKDVRGFPLPEATPAGHSPREDGARAHAAPRELAGSERCPDENVTSTAVTPQVSSPASRSTPPSSAQTRALRLRPDYLERIMTKLTRRTCSGMESRSLRSRTHHKDYTAFSSPASAIPDIPYRLLRL